jgi:hypothetical protein
MWPILNASLKRATEAKAFYDYFLLFVCEHHQQRRHDDKRADPNASNNHTDFSVCTIRSSFHWLIDYVITIDAYCGQRHYTHANSNALSKTTETTHVFPKHPLIINQMRDGNRYANENDQQIGQGQVCYEFVCHCLHAFVHKHKIDNNEIANEANKKHGRINKYENFVRPQLIEYNVLFLVKFAQIHHWL